MKIKLNYAQFGSYCDVSGVTTWVVEQLLYHKNPNTQNINQKLMGQEWAPCFMQHTHPAKSICIPITVCVKVM